MIKARLEFIKRANRNRILATLQRNELRQYNGQRPDAATRAAARWFIHLSAKDLLDMYRRGQFPIIQGGKA